MPTPWDQKKKAEMARMLAEAEADAIKGSDTPDSLLSTRGFTFGGPEGGWEAFKAGFGKEATYGFGDEAAAALSGVETTDEERIATNEEMDAVINKNAINAALGFVGGVVPAVATLGYGAITNAATKAATAAGMAAGKLAAKEVVKTITPKMAVGINAAEGAVSGVGEGEGVEGRIVGGITGATIGGLVGSAAQAIPGVTRAVADTVSNDRKIQNAASEMAKEDAERLARELAFQQSIKVNKFNTGYPLLDDEIKSLNKQKVAARREGDKAAEAEIDVKLKPLNALKTQKRPELATEAARLAALESNKNAAFTKTGFRASMTDDELEAAADALEVAKAVKGKNPIIVPPERSVDAYAREKDRRLNPRARTNKNPYGNDPAEEATKFEDIDIGAEEKAIETAVKTSHAARKKTQSREFFNNRRFYDQNIDDIEVKDILKNPNHPLLAEPIQAAASANKGYQLAINEWQANKNKNWKTGERDYIKTGEELMLMNSDLAPVQRSKLAFKDKPDPNQPGGYLISEEPAVKDLYKPNNTDVTWERQDTFGQGVYGRVYPVIDRNGKPKAAKISFVDIMNRSIAAESHAHEKEVARAIQNVKANATPTEKSLYLKHFPDFEQVLDRPDNSSGYIFVMDELRPMNDIEKAELFEGRTILKELLEKKGYKNVDAYMDPSGKDFILPIDSDFSAHPAPAIMANLPWKDKYRRVLSADDYNNMTPRVRSAYKALEFMSSVKGIGWGDLHALGNAMINPKTGDYVFQDVGLFQLRDASNALHRYDKTRNYDQRLQAEVAGAEARVGDAEALAADIAENEAIAAARAPRPLADKATVERARAAAKDIKALSPAEMARRFKQPNRSAGAMAAEPGFYEDENGQMMFWSGQEMRSVKPNAISTRPAAAPEQMELDFTEQMELDFTERNNNVALELARRDTPSNKKFPGKRAPSPRSRMARSKKPTTTAMVPLDSEAMIDRAKGPGILSRIGKAYRSATNTPNLKEFREERNYLESDYDFSYAKLANATTEREIRTAERELDKAYDDLRVHIIRYPDIIELQDKVDYANEMAARVYRRIEANKIGDLTDEEILQRRLMNRKDLRALRADAENVGQEKRAVARQIENVFYNYPDLKRELAPDHPVRAARRDWQR